MKLPSTEGKGAFALSVLINPPAISRRCCEVRPGAEVKASFSVLGSLTLIPGEQAEHQRDAWEGTDHRALLAARGILFHPKGCPPPILSSPSVPKLHVSM